jgi:hypothetical protein
MSPLRSPRTVLARLAGIRFRKVDAASLDHSRHRLAVPNTSPAPTPPDSQRMSLARRRRSR